MKVGNEKIEQNILEQTKHLLLKYGIKGWNMDDLALECGMSKRTLYKIIGTKEELISKLIYNNINMSIRRLELCVAEDIPFERIYSEWLKLTVIGLEGYILVNMKVIEREFLSTAKILEELTKKHDDITLNFFEKGIEFGYFLTTASAETYSKMVHAIIDYNINRYVDDKTFREECYSMLQTLFSGIIKQ